MRVGDGNHGPNQRTWGVILATVAACIAHVFDFGLIQVAHFVLLLVGSELKGVHQVQDFTEVVPAVNFVFEFGENLSDFVLNRLGVIGALFESCEVREQVAVHKLHQVGTRHGLVVVKLSILAFGTCPHVPAVLSPKIAS